MPKAFGDLHIACLKQAHKSGYVSVPQATLLALQVGGQGTLAQMDARARRALRALVRTGLAQEYVKAKGLRVYGLSAAGAEYLRDQHGITKAKATLVAAQRACHVVHRTIADLLVMLLQLHADRREVTTGSLVERQILQGRAGTFKDDFRKLPDGLLVSAEDRSFVAVEVDTVKRNKRDTGALLRAFRAMDSTVPGSAVADRFKPLAVAWLVPSKGEGARQHAERALAAAGFAPHPTASEEDQQAGRVFIGPEGRVSVVVMPFDFKAPAGEWLQMLNRLAVHPYLALEF